MIEKSAQPVGFSRSGDPSPGPPEGAPETFESLPAIGAGAARRAPSGQSVMRGQGAASSSS